MLTRRLWLGVVLMILVAGWPTKVAAHNPAMSLSPSVGPVGTLVTLSVTGFDPDRAAEVFWNQEELGAFPISADGSGAMQFSVPSTTPGNYQVLVLCMTCQPPIGERADAWFEVSASELTPTPTGSLPTATHTASLPTAVVTMTPLATATFTCEQVSACTATPTPTSPPAATPTSISVITPSSLPSLTVLPPSPTSIATSTSCVFLANCTVTPTRVVFTPSATPSATPTPGPTLTARASRSPTFAVTPSQTVTPVQSSATPTMTPPALIPILSNTDFVIASPTPTTSARGAESVLVILTVLLGGIVIILGGWLSWRVRRGG